MDSLQRDGYTIFRGALTDDDVIQARSYISGQQMDYSAFRTFIELKMLQIIGRKLQKDIHYTKFRVSNNNNSVDAGAFHRDIMPVHKSSAKLPIYTCLCYLDSTVMEIIPGSHNSLHMTHVEALSKYSNAEKISFSPNDLFIFDSTLIHRGIFTEGLENRRLIQVFNCCLSREELKAYSAAVIDVPGDDTFSDISKSMYLNSYTSFIPNLLGYLNSATGGNVSDSEGFDSCSFNIYKFAFYSSEGLCKRITIEPNTMQETNKYCIVYPKTTLPLECKSEYMYLRYNRQLYIYIAVFLFLIISFIIFAGALIVYIYYYTYPFTKQPFRYASNAMTRLMKRV